MVFEIILLAVAFGGSILAAFYDLKTTEVPDWVFYAMLGIGLPVVIGRSLIENNFSYLINSAIAGGGLIGFGYFMYRIGQWGGADSVLLGLFGFLLPTLPSNFSPVLIFPFPVSLLFNIFIVGLVYMLIYSTVFAFANRHVLNKFMGEMKASAKIIGMSTAALFAAIIAMGFYFSEFFTLEGIFVNGLIAAIGTILFFVVYKFAHAVENFGFKKKIPISKLRIGDVLLKSKQWEGIDQKTLLKVKRSGERFVWIKEGVRFIPAFPLALFFTLYFGDAISYLISFL